MTNPTLESVQAMDIATLLDFLKTRVQPEGPPVLCSEERIKTFESLEMDGWMFVRTTAEMYRSEYKLEKIAFIYRLTGLVDFLRQNGAKRSASGAGFEEESVQSKRRKQEELSLLMAENKYIEEQLDKLLDVPADAQFTDPASKKRIPFPFSGPIPTRFRVSDQHFEFFGRSAFRKLFETVKRMNIKTNRRMFFHGLLGAGKSHLVAALVVAVKKDPDMNLLVCYIPDCHELVVGEPSRYITCALCSAFYSETEESSLKAEIMKLLENLGKLTPESQELSLRSFCINVANAGRTILFVVDQANALDDTLAEGDRVPNAKKARVRILLDEISHLHLKFESSTANYRAGKYDMSRNISEKRVVLNTGLDNTEMTQWWETVKQELRWEITQGERIYFERLTGRMPILLSALKDSARAMLGGEEASAQTGITIFLTNPGQLVPALANSSPAQTTPTAVPVASPTFRTLNIIDTRACLIQSDEVQKMQDRIATFASQQINCLEGRERDLRLFYDVWKACILEMEVGTEGLHLLDSRYFYVDGNGIGRSSSDLAREVGAAILEKCVNPIDYRSDSVWLNRLATFADNPSVLGFVVEKIAIGHLLLEGSYLADRFIDDKGDLIADIRMPTKQDHSASFGGQAPRRVTFGSTPFIESLQPEVEPFQILKAGVITRNLGTVGAMNHTTSETLKSYQSILYIPAVFNYPSVDSVLVMIPPSAPPKVPSGGKRGQPKASLADALLVKGKVIVVGIQFTISDSHRPTEEPFMRKWRDWVNSVPSGDAEFEFRFLWVLESLENATTDWEFVPEKNAPVTRGGGPAGRTVHPEYYRRRITFDQLYPLLGKKLALARKLAGTS